LCLVFKGGSWVSTGDEASRFARFAFRRHFFQHLGFRVVQSVTDGPPVRLVGTPVFVLGVGVEGNCLFSCVVMKRIFLLRRTLAS